MMFHIYKVYLIPRYTRHQFSEEIHSPPYPIGLDFSFRRSSPVPN
jgi:hypothetical protein